MAVISDALWRRRFRRAEARSLAASRAAESRRPTPSSGVAEPSAIGSFVGAPVDVWVPIESIRHRSWRPLERIDRAQRTLALDGAAASLASRRRARRAKLQLIAVRIAREFTGDGVPDDLARRPPVPPGPDHRSCCRRHWRPAISGASPRCFCRCCSGLGGARARRSRAPTSRTCCCARVLGRRRETGGPTWRLARAGAGWRAC